MNDVLRRLQELVLEHCLPEPDYMVALPGGDQALLAYGEERAAVVAQTAQAEGWRLFPCNPDDPTSVEAAMLEMAIALGYLSAPTTQAALPATPAQPAPQGLTDEQRAAAIHAGGPARILAGAGTGKTRVIVNRFHHLVRQGVTPERILALTFSREAARAMRDAILPELQAAPRLWVSTFHSFCLKVLEAEGVTGLRLLQEPERRTMLAAVCENGAWQHYVGTHRRLLVDEALTFIGQAKDYLLTPDDVARYAEATGQPNLADLAEAYRLYQEELARQGAAEFADFIARTVALLEGDAAAAARWQGRFDQILVDEFQDTNLAQFRVLQVLARAHQNLVVVGDDDQAIYHFRGASDRFLVHWEEHYPEAQTYRVEENFRCPAPVLEAANALIRHNAHTRVEKRLYTTTRTAGFPPVRYWEAQTEREEAEAVAREIAARIHKGEAAPGHFAILCRSLRRTGGEIARALARRSIPCRVVGEEEPHPLIRQTLALLRLTRATTTPDLLQVMAGRIPPAELYAALRTSTLAPDPALQGWLDEHQKADLPTLVYQALRFLGHLRLTLQPTTADVDRLTAARELQEQAAQAADLDQLLRLYAEGAPGASRATAGDAVTLMTMHAAKGLEFPVVFVVGMAEGLFPVTVDTSKLFYAAELIRDWIDSQGAAPVPAVAERLAGHLCEERRLAYVALTRARSELILTRARQYGQEPADPSRFLAELGAPPPERVQLGDPLPDARSYLLKVAAGFEPGTPERVAEAMQLMTRHPQSVPLRRQEEPAPFTGSESLRLSATALEQYRECPRRYYYGQVFRLEDEDNIALAFGSGLHEALERYHRAMQAGEQPTGEQLDRWWQASLDRTRCETEGQYQQLLRRGQIFLERYRRWSQGRWKRIIQAEDRFEVPYVDRAGRAHRLVGRYDLIAETHDGTVEICDFKTGKRSYLVNKTKRGDPEKQPNRKLQLGLYYLAHLGGQIDPRVRVQYIFLRHEKDEYPGDFVPDFDPGEQAIGCAHDAESVAAIRQMVDETVEAILANRFERTLDTSKCDRCFYRNVCEVSPRDWF